MREMIREHRRTSFVASVALVVGLLGAVVAFANTPPAPFDASTATANALNGVVKSFGCNTSNGITQTAAWVDVLSQANFGGCTSVNDVTAANASATRIVTVKLAYNDGTSANWRGCVELGGDGASGHFALGCAARDTAGANGSCSLINAGDVCQWTIRPQISGCTSWDTCHLPLWVRASAATANKLVVSVSQ